MTGSTTFPLAIVPSHRAWRPGSCRSVSTRGLTLLPALLALLLATVSTAHAQSKEQWRAQRLRMVREDIEREGISNPRVLAAMRSVPRHEFVPGNLRASSYVDTALAIGKQQTISPPFVVAYMTETLDPQPEDKVLEIGTGSGYQAAVLAETVKEVYSIEIVESLGKSAAERLKRLGYKNVTCKVGDGYLGWAEHAPFDKIIVTCSPEKVPQPLIDQLRDGGRMIIPLGERYQQVFHRFEKRDGQLVDEQLIPTLFVPMTGRSEDQRAVLPDPLRPSIRNGDFTLDANEDGLPDEWHYQRQSTRVVAPGSTDNWCIALDNEELGRLAQALQGGSIDGARIRSIQFACRYRTDGIRPGSQRHERAGASIHFYDAQRRVIGEETLGPWSGTTDWTDISRRFAVPQEAREFIVRIGLNGATGRLWVDEISLTLSHQK